MTPRSQRLIQICIIALAALLAVLPLAIYGYSCGHDFDFHLRSWMEASAQWHAGILKPVWAFHAAWSAGEPRLLFYPPLSWVTGALMTSVLPWMSVSTTFTWLVLLLSGLAMHRLVRRWATGGVATLAACIYLANPYMLFCAYERTAYAELMAAAWMPLLLAALLRPRVSVWRVAVAIALLWLTNAPAAVVGCYTVLLIGSGRMFLLWRKDPAAAKHYGVTLTAGFALGLLADAFYLLPMALARKYVQLDLAIVPNARPDANYLFTHTGDEFHDGVLVHSSLIGIGLVALALLSGVTWFLLRRRRVEAFHSMHARDSTLRMERGGSDAAAVAVPVLMVFSVIVLFLLSRFSAPVWHVAPELVFLQFPWRFLAVQSSVSVLLLALCVERMGQWRGAARLPWPALAAGGVCIAALAAFLGANNGFRQGCDEEEGLEIQRSVFARGDGFEQTDEYTPVGASNEALRIHLPAAWIADTAAGVPDGQNGEPTATTLLPTEEMRHPDDLVFQGTVPAPSKFLVIRIRQFRGWHIFRDGVEVMNPLVRLDGLTAVPLPRAGAYRIELRYQYTADQWIGALLSCLGLGCVVGLARRESKLPPARITST
jgi:hypothetical protein